MKQVGIKELMLQVDLDSLLSENINIDDKSALFIVDMNNGFAKKGALYSKEVEDLIPEVVKVTEKFADKDCPIIAFSDCHTEDSPEFLTYPKHCLEGTEEVELVDELKEFGDKIELIYKKSTNAFLEKATYKKINSLITDKGIKKFFVVGCLSEICVLQFCITLKSFLTSININSDVIVPIKAIDTFNSATHNRELNNILAVMDLAGNNIKLISDIE